MDDVTIAKLVERWNQGVPVKKIAEEIGETTQEICTYASRNRDKCPLRIQRKKINKNRLIELWKIGVPIKEIAEQLGITSADVLNFVRTHRKECPKRYGNYDGAKIEEMKNEGKTKREIAEVLDVKFSTVVGYVRRNNLKKL